MAGGPFASLQIYNAAIASTTTPPPPPPPAPSSPHEPTHKNPQSPSPTTCFRLLCHSSRIGGVIGKSGSVIKQIQEDTSSIIRIDDAPPDSEFRVVNITANSTIDKTMSFDEEGYEEEEISDEYSEVSAAQEGLVRVFERILTVAAETDGCYFAPGGVVSCKLLTNTNHVGFIIGRGGKVVEKMKRDTGCRIRIFNKEKMPACASPSDEIIEIEGGIVAVKKALIAVSRRIQDCLPPFRPRMTFIKPENRFNCEPMVPYGHTDQYPLTRPQNGFNPDHQNQRCIAFRMLCTRELVGGIIGGGGSIIRAFENQTGANISIAYPVHKTIDRLITITANESPETPNSPAQNAVILVFGRSVETLYERGLDSPLSGMPISARLVIPHYQTGCLLGKGGSVMEDMRKVTGALIKIISGNNFPGCASEADEVVLVTGKFVNVRDALFSITTRLRNRMFEGGPKTHTRGLGQPGQPPFEQYSSLTANHFSQHASLTQSMDNLRLSNNEEHHSSSFGPCQSQTGSSSGTSGIELGRGGRSAIITNTSVEIMVPQNDIGCVYGENGSNLTRLRQISGAKVVVHEPSSRKGDYVIVISGSPDQTQSAQSLLQAFILADQDLHEGQDCN